MSGRSVEGVKNSPVKTEDLAIVYRPIDELIPYARNARTHTDAQVAQIAASIREFGWTNPILLDGDRGIIAGHGRLLAARKLGLRQVPTIELAHLSDGQRRAYIIADNKLALNAGWDEEMLRVEFVELSGAGFDLSLLGFGEDELAEITGDPQASSHEIADSDDEVPEIAPEAITRRGDVWILGDHRLMCGDCRESDDVSTLLRGERVNLAFTSPPYAQQREYDATSGFKPIHPDEYVDWFAAVARNVRDNLAHDGSWFVNIKPSAEGLDTSLYVFDLVIAHVRDWGWHFATEFCWERAGIPKGVTRRFKNQFEPIYQFAAGEWKMRPHNVRRASDAVPIARGKGAGNTSWSRHQGGGLESIHMSGKQGTPGFEWFGENVQSGMAFPGNRLPTFAGSHEALGHSAAFPVGLPAFFIDAYTDAKDVVFDPFCGSGSTLIASERKGRLGRGIEISPIYCDVIVRRWQKVSEQEATLDGDGRTFDEVSAERIGEQHEA